MTAGIYGFNSPGRDRHAVLLPAGGGERRPAGRRLRRGGARDPADAAIRAVPDVHHAVHRHDLGLLLPGAGPGRRPVEPGGPLVASRLRRGRGPRRQPGDVPGEHLDGALVPGRHRPERLAARVVGAGGLGRRHAGGELPRDRGGAGSSTPRASSNAPAREHRAGALRLQRDTGGRRPVPVEAVADPAAPGHPALGSCSPNSSRCSGCPP